MHCIKEVFTDVEIQSIEHDVLILLRAYLTISKCLFQSFGHPVQNVITGASPTGTCKAYSFF